MECFGAEFKENVKKDFKPLEILLRELQNKYNDEIDLIQFVSSYKKVNNGEPHCSNEIHVVFKSNGLGMGLGDRVIIED